MSNKILAKVFGQEYTLRSEKPEEEVKQIIEYVDKQMWSVCSQLKHTDGIKVAVLSAINIAQGNFDLQNEVREKQAIIEKLNSEISEHLQKCKEYDVEHQKDTLKIQALTLMLEENSDEIKVLQEKYKEQESAYFELKMENVKLKNLLK